MLSVKKSNTAEVVLTEADGEGLAGRTLRLEAEVRRGRNTSTETIATAVTGADGTAVFEVPSKNKSAALRAVFDGDASFLPASDQ